MIYKANILVVDDDPAVCKSVANVLEKEGYAVDIVFNGEEAIEKEKKNQYAIALIDLMLPGISGIDVLQNIKKRNPHITIIMMTGYPSVKTAIQAIKMNAFDYISKPFDPAELRCLVASALERRMIYEEIASSTGTVEKKLVNILIPEDIYCIPNHSWAKIEKKDVRIGMHHVYSWSIKGIQSIVFPDENEIKYQGEVCMKIVDLNQQVFRLRSPITGKVLGINHLISKNFPMLRHTPYTDGWLMILKPIHLEEDIKLLNYIEKNVA